jgi:solute carrier family 25 (mitochondrial carnitine/acylcarnitine transporter), member 20/29
MVLLGIHFPTFTKTKAYLDQTMPTPATEFSHSKTLAAGAAAGLAGSLVSCPSEHIRTKMQLQRRVQLAQKLGGAAAQGLETYTGSLNCASRILSQHGISGLYRGFTSTVMRDMQGGWQRRSLVRPLLPALCACLLCAPAPALVPY